jgi:hypothetical protein
VARAPVIDTPIGHGVESGVRAGGIAEPRMWSSATHRLFGTDWYRVVMHRSEDPAEGWTVV